MKILQINSVCGIKSTGRICTDIARIINEENNECIVAYGRGNVPNEYVNISKRIGTKYGVKLHALQSRILDNSGFASKKDTIRLLKWIEEWNPDLIHIHNIHGYYINVEFLFSFLKRRNKPVVWTLHDCWAFTGHCTYFDFVECNKWINNSCDNCPQKRKYPTSIFFDSSKKNIQRKKSAFTEINNLTIVTPSNWLARLVKQSFLREYDLKVIHNGIDLNVFKPKFSDLRNKFNLEGKTLILAVADGWSSRKGFLDIIELSKYLMDNERIVMIGFTKKEKICIPYNIIALPNTNNITELIEWYSVADVFINPTYEDNYPTVNLEAQACGTPVITYKTGGSIESVPIGNVVETGRIDELLNRIRNYKFLELFSSVNFDKYIAYKEYLSLYKKMI